MKNLMILLLAGLSFLSCTTEKPVEEPKETPVAEKPSYENPELIAKARELSQKFAIVDGHVDLPYRLRNYYERVGNRDENVGGRTEQGEMDFERAREGGLDAPFMSIYTPAGLQGTGENYVVANELIDLVEELVSKWPDKFAIARTVAEVKEIKDKGMVALPMGLENGAPIEGKIENVKHFYDRGIRYITLTHGKNNHICDSSYDDTRKWNGMSEFGREVVQEMNRLGIMVDISHVSDDAFYQVMEMTKVPAIASHSSCRHFTPGFERNMSDDMIKKLAENGGVIMINFGSSFIDENYRQARMKAREDYNAFKLEHNLEDDDPKLKEMREKAAKEIGYADMTVVADHIDHVVKLVGIDYVGFGSDFDGVGDSLPIGLKDVSQFPNLLAELLKRGYSEEDIEKICSGNVFRVWSEVEKYAAAQAEK